MFSFILKWSSCLKCGKKRDNQQSYLNEFIEQLKLISICNKSCTYCLRCLFKFDIDIFLSRDAKCIEIDCEGTLRIKALQKAFEKKAPKFNSLFSFNGVKERINNSKREGINENNLKTENPIVKNDYSDDNANNENNSSISFCFYCKDYNSSNSLINVCSNKCYLCINCMLNHYSFIYNSNECVNCGCGLNNLNELILRFQVRININ